MILHLVSVWQKTVSNITFEMENCAEIEEILIYPYVASVEIRKLFKFRQLNWM